MSLFENSDQMWFGTVGNMRWIQAPQTGMDSSPQANSESSILIDGDGYSRKSWNSHKLYDMSWSDSETPRFAQLIQAYASGAYGRGPFYFQDPLSYGVNVLPIKWSYPAVSVGGNGGRLIEGQRVLAIDTAPNHNDLPSQTASFTIPASFNTSTSGFDWDGAVFVPIPEGHSLFLGAFYESLTPGVGIAVAPVSESGEVEFGSSIQLPQLLPDEVIVVPTRIDSGVGGGVVMYLFNTTASGAKISFTASIGRISDTGATGGYFISGYGDLPYGEGLYGGSGYDYDGFLSAPWSIGMGNSGCAFDGQPTLVEYTGIGEGQVGLSCTLREVGILYG